MPITISTTRKLPLDLRGAQKDPNSLRAILEGMTAGQSFFVEKGGEYTEGTLRTVPWLVSKATGHKFTIRRMTEKGEVGLCVFCVKSAPAPLALVRGRR